MKVLYISKALVVAEYRMKLHALARHAEIVGVIPDSWGSRPIEDDSSSFETRMLRRERVWFAGHNHLHLYPSLAKVIDSQRPDLIHIDEEPYSAVTLQATRLGAARGIPCLFFAWQNLKKRLPPPFERIRATVYRTAAGGIAGTPAAAGVLRGSGFTGPLAIIPQFGVDVSRFTSDPVRRAADRSSIAIGADELVVGFGGRLVRGKGVDLLLQAVSRLTDGRLLIAGDGPDRLRLSRLAETLGVGARTHFIGQIPSTRMPEFLGMLDVLVLPSRRTRGWAEQFGRILVEAMACGVPVVGAESGEIPHVIGDAGILTREGDAEALGDALVRLRSDPELRRKLGEAGRARAFARFTQERIARLTMEFYRDLRLARAA